MATPEEIETIKTQTAKECYHNKQKLPKGRKKANTKGKSLSVNMLDLDPREEYQQERIEPTEDLKGICIGSEPHQVTKLGTTLQPEKKLTLTKLLQENMDLFAWKPSNMPERSQRSVSSSHR